MEDSVETQLAELDPSDLEAMANALEQLVEHPGWAALQHLVEAYRNKAVVQMTYTAHDRATAYAHTAGRILAVDRIMGLPEKVQAARQRERARAARSGVMN